jgi:hypothetical protein
MPKFTIWQMRDLRSNLAENGMGGINVFGYASSVATLITNSRTYWREIPNFCSCFVRGGVLRDPLQAGIFVNDRYFDYSLFNVTFAG